MTPAKNIKRLIKKLQDTTSAQMDRRVLGDVLRALEESEKTSTPTRRTIMKSPITKLAAAAVIIVAVMLSMNIWDKSIPTAYALNQTVEANHTVRYIHIKDLRDGKDEPKEFWVECDQFGQVKNVRMHLPEWSSPHDGAKVIVWKENKVQVYFKRKNLLFIATDKTVADRMLKLVEECDPRLAVERLYEQEQQSKIKIEIEEPSNKTEPIIVTATHLPESPTPDQRAVLSVDQATRLVTAIELYQLKDGKYQHLGLMEFCEYNQPIDAQMFALDGVPDDVMRIDQTTQEIGLAQGDLSDEEIAVKVVQQFFKALIAEDYAKAGKLMEGIPAERMQQGLGHIKFLRIVSIGPVAPHPIPETKGLVVPCTVEIEKDGQTSEWKLDRLVIRQVFNQPGRWTIFGGI
jgi:hypothetical protein